MRGLIAIVTCQAFRAKADVLRRTWVPLAKDFFDVKFFLGMGSGQPASDEVYLDAADDYRSLPLKVQKAFSWAVAQGYDRIVKLDDDVYVLPEKLDKAIRSTCNEYFGRLRAPSRENDAPRLYGPKESYFCSGFSYVVSARAARVVAETPWNTDFAEDRFAGNVLARAGFVGQYHPGFKLWPPLNGHVCAMPHGTCQACLFQYHDAVTVCPYAQPDAIEKIHQIFLETGAIPVHL